MTSSRSWPLRRSADFKGQWVALDNCRYDHSTLQPIEGDVVDSDSDLAELCSRLREAGKSSCAIVFCDDEVVVTSPKPPASPRERSRLTG
jgi:hypothetical protein